MNNRDVIAVPFGKPDGDLTILIGDWYNKDYKVSNRILVFYFANASFLQYDIRDCGDRILGRNSTMERILGCQMVF